MAVTIKDIAKEAGVGCATVSAYLNGVTVRPYNKEKIEKAVKRLGFIRNDYARGLKTHTSKTIGVLIPELSNIFATTIISEMEEVFRERGYGIIVCDCRSDLKLEQNAIRFLLSKMVDGLIVMPVSGSGKAMSAALENKVPVVVIDRMTDCKQASHVVINNKEISKEAVKRLIAKGCKKIAIITGDTRVYTAGERCRGYREAMTESGFYDQSYVFDGKFSVEGGYLAAKDMMEKKPDIDGIFVTNYEMTVGSLIALSEKNVTIGRDVAYIGFDSVEMAKAFTPNLVTVNQPLKEIGNVAANTMLSLIKGEPVRNIELTAQIKAP